MGDSTTMTIRLDADLRSRLDRLAESMQRPESALAAEAIAAYVDLNAWQIDEIRKGLEEADRGETVQHEEVLREVAALRTELAAK